MTPNTFGTTLDDGWGSTESGERPTKLPETSDDVTAAMLRWVANHELDEADRR